MILCYVTCKDIEEAQKISRTLLESNLAACANFFPIHSMYWWKGSINQDNEFVVILKTFKEKFKEVEKKIKEVHSYECPCILSIDIKDANKEFLEYIKKEIKD